MIEIPIRNMVCARCIKVVKGIFDDAGASVKDLVLGKVTLEQALTAQQTTLIRDRLAQEGFEWLDDQKRQLVENIKKEILQLVHYGELDEMRENLSAYLSSRLHKDYHYLSNTFSMVENITIEQYFILQKIEKIKELLVYGELTLNEIAFR